MVLSEAGVLWKKRVEVIVLKKGRKGEKLGARKLDFDGFHQIYTIIKDYIVRKKSQSSGSEITKESLSIEDEKFDKIR